MVDKGFYYLVHDNYYDNDDDDNDVEDAHNDGDENGHVNENDGDCEDDKKMLTTMMITMTVLTIIIMASTTTMMIMRRRRYLHQLYPTPTISCVASDPYKSTQSVFLIYKCQETESPSPFVFLSLCCIYLPLGRRHLHSTHV